MQHDLNNTIDDDSYGSHSHHIISPWIMSNEEKEDLIKNGSDIDKFNKEKPSFGNAAVPFEYKSNDGAGDPGTWGGI